MTGFDLRAARAEARRLFDLGVAAADPGPATAAHLAGIAAPVLILAIGKAARGMAGAALHRFPGTPCLVVTNDENALPLPGARVLAAAHPVPDARGLAAAEEVLAALRQARGPVLALISGGGSALLPAPVAGVTLAEKAALNRLLLGAGLDIRAMNLVRQQVSRLKGGGLLHAAAPNPVTALILSDVVGDDLSTIASGLTAPPLGTAAQARAVLAPVRSALPESIRAHLDRDAPVPPTPPARNILVGSNAMSLAAMAVASPGARRLPLPVEGDVAEAARPVCAAAGPGVTLWGGETTVRLRGAGRGGRNQEMALHIAREAARLGWGGFVCLQGGSDGRDGPTEAAGGLVDHGTLDRIAAAGGEIGALLAENDSNRALALSGDLLLTGATGTNVADLGVLIRA